VASLKPITHLGLSENFAKSIYFSGQVNSWNGNLKELSSDFILMTDNSNLVELKKVNQAGNYYFYTNK
jgi:hypothetical protein